MTAAYRCTECGDEPAWRLDRRGDAVVAWACDVDLLTVVFSLQRLNEVTELVVRPHRGSL